MVDTREQLPYSTSNWGLNQTPTHVFAKLDSGDYSIQGHEHEVAVERKRPCELFGCFTTDRARFRREFERLATYRFAAVVIEGYLEDCATIYNTWQEDGETRVGHVPPALVVNSLISWAVRYNVHIIFASNRHLAQTYTYRILEKFAAMIAREAAEAPPASNPSP